MTRKTIVALTLVAVGLGGLWLSLSTLYRPPAWMTATWTDEMEMGERPDPGHLGRAMWKGQWQGQEVTLRAQEIAGVPVEGSFVKILSRQGQPTWVSAKYLREDELPKAPEVARELGARDQVAERSLDYANKDRCRISGDLQPGLRHRMGRWQLIFKRHCERDGHLFELAFNTRGGLVDRQIVGSRFTWTQTTISVYPRGPKLSPLQPLDVGVSSQPQFLRTPNLTVDSDAGLRFSELDELNSITPEDPAFDLVQAYFYATESLKWVESTYRTRLDPLKVRTHFGHPGKDSAAFYFGREVRLGTGDGITFDRIAWDPTIVVHELMHGVIEMLTGLPLGRGEGGSIQEALADALTALQLDTPRMGESAYKNGPYQRSLDTDLRLSDRNGKLYHDSLILSSTIWALKSQLGEGTGVDLVGHLLMHSTPATDFADVKTQIQDWFRGCAEGERCDRIGSILSQRGWL